MQYVRNTIRRHWGALLLAFAVGAVFASFHVFLEIRYADDPARAYYPITYDASFDEAAGYGPRMHAVAGGDILAGDISIDEYGESGPAILPIANPIILGGMEYVLGSQKVALFVASFIFPLLIFLGLYFLVYEVLGSRYVALLAALVFIFIPDINNYLQIPKPQAISDIFLRFAPFFNSGVERLYFLKFEYPLVTYPFYLAALYTLARALIRDERLTPFLAGVAFGLLFYTYFYDWTYLVATFGVLVVIFLVRREARQVKKIGIIVGTGLLVSVPYWINAAALQALPTYHDIVSRVGVELSHAPRLSIWKNYLRTLIVVAGLFIFVYRYARTHVIYIVGLLLASFVVFNAHVITGFAPQPDHWFRLQFLPMALGELCIIYYLFRRFITVPSVVTRTFFAATVVLMLSGGFYSAYAFGAARADYYGVNRGFIEGYAWLNENTPEGSVVGTLSLSHSSALLSHTHNRVFLPFGLLTYASNAEIWDRYMILTSAFGVSPATFAEEYAAGEIDTPGFRYNKYIFHNAYADTSLDAYNGYVNDKLSRAIPPNVQEAANEKYQQYYANPPLRNMPYRLDYLLLIKEDGYALAHAISATLVFGNADVSIYRVR